MTISALQRAVIFCMIAMFPLALFFAGGVETACAASERLVAIESISIAGSGDSAVLLVKLSSPTTYTSYKTTAPLRLVLDLSRTTQGTITTPQLINTGNVKTVTASSFDTDAGVLTRIDIELVKDAEPVIATTPENPGELRISFAPLMTQKLSLSETNPVQPKAVTEVSSVSVQAAAIEPRPKSSHVLTGIAERDGKVVLTFEGGVGDFKTTRYRKPDRLVLDLGSTRSLLSSKSLSLQSLGGSVATIGQFPDKVRVVFEAHNGILPDIEVTAVTDGLVLVPGTIIKNSIPAEAAHEENKSDLKLMATRSGVKIKEPAPVASSPATASGNKVSLSSGIPMVEMIDFQVLDGVSRIAIKVAGDVRVEQPVQGSGVITLILKNTGLPKHLQRSLETQAFASPVFRITPLMVSSRKGSDTQIRIALRVAAEHAYRREADMLYVDVQHPAGGMIVEAPGVSTAADALPTANTFESGTPRLSGAKKNTVKNVSLDFDNAELRHIFRLLADVSQRNFIVGDDVKGTMSIKLTNVPWEQALELILDSKGLVMREQGNVVSIMTKETYKAKSKEELEIQEQKNRVEKEKTDVIELKTGMFNLNYSDLTSIVAQLTSLKTKRGSISQDVRTNKIIVTDLPDVVDKMARLVQVLDVPEKQVMIEARIVEATSTFTRSLGVNWGIHYRDGTAALLGINQLDSSFGGITTTAPPLTGVNGQAGAAAGISFGTLTSNIQLDLRLNAAASAGLIKIVSTPKVATLNNKTAKITQGQQVPYTSSTSDKVETKFVEAALSLEVTPHINSNGTIGMKIDAKNDSVGQATGGSTAPAINKKQATTEMLLRDGETTVIGGIYVDNDVESDDGVPYLMDIPYLGKLFRSNNKTKIKTELLIFITPRILGDV